MKNGQFPAVIQLSSLNGQNGFKVDGENAGDNSGFSVSSAGDINGDGYDDLIIGAFGYPQGNNTGRSYVMFGGQEVGNGGDIALSSLNGSNGFKLDGEHIKDSSGISVSAAGDINGDSYADLLIGGVGYLGGANSGRSYVLFGGQGVGSSGVLSLSSVNGFKLDGENNNDGSGFSVSAIDDINGDGYADLLIGADGYPGGSAKGRSYVVFGKSGVGSGGVFSLASLNGTNGFKLDGENSNDYSGYSVSGAGDINNDGYADLLIGAPYYLGQAGRGRSYVVFGGLEVGSGGVFSLASLNGINGFKLNGENNLDYSGISVSTAGDINDDGYADLIIGAHGYGNGEGRSYVVFGGAVIGGDGTFNLSSLNGANGFKLNGENGGDHSGASVSSVGDINGDGYVDLLIGAFGYPGGGWNGRTYVMFGQPGIGHVGVFNLSSINGINGFKLDGENNDDRSGNSVSAAGDINGDGVDDLIIGAFAYPAGSAKGCSYVVFGDVPPVLVNNSLSLSVGAAIQLNSTYLAAYDRNHNNNTLVFIPSAITHGYFSTTTAPGTSLVNFTQQQVSNSQIQFVHDGTLVAPSYNITVRSTGIAWTGPSSARINFIGAPQSYFPAILPLAGLNGQNGFKLDGENNNDWSGSTVGVAGDINGDGYADLIIGASYYAASTGRSYVVFGDPNVGSSGIIALSALNGTQGFKLNGEAMNDQSGVSVNGAGDINGDGYADLLIGANYHGASLTGRSYVVFGGPKVGGGGMITLSNLNGSNGFKLDGEQVGEQSGTFVNAAGDINGDNYADIIIGAQFWNGIGRSYLVFGGPGVGSKGTVSLANLTGSNGFKLNGESIGDWSGYSVSTAGDINQDGYADLLIGSPHHSNLTGCNYVVLGGPNVGNSGVVSLSNLTGASGFKLEGETSNDQNGYYVSAAGDINGDNVADLLIGAPFHNNLIGRSYAVFGSSNLGISGMIILADLSGSNGFKLDGENNGDYNGIALSGIGDFNGDGFGDVLVGAHNYKSGIGRSYVIFGGLHVGSGGLLPLSILNGVNGFKLDGESLGDISGRALSAAGDINGDGVMDILIGAQGHNNSTGRSYVVFGDIPPTLVQNRLTLHPGNKVPLNSTFLSAYDRNHNNNTLAFIISALTHGHFELTGKPGVALSNFTQSQLANNTVLFIHDGSSVAPSYNITVRSAGIAWTGPSMANITFIPVSTTISPSPSSPPPTVTPSQMVTTMTPTFSTTSSPATTPSPVVTSTPVASTPTPVLTTTVIPTTASPSPSLLTPTVSPTRTIMPTQAVTSTPVLTSSTTSQPPTTLKPTPTPTPTSTPTVVLPILINNQLTLNNGQTVVLSSSNLQAMESGLNASGLLFIVGNLQNGYFAAVPLNDTAIQLITSFTQQAVNTGQVQFTHLGNRHAPSYAVTVSDGRYTTAPNPAIIYFQGAPLVTQNTLSIQPGQTITLTPADLNVTVTDGSTPNQVVCQVSNVQHATFTSTQTGASVSNFTLNDIQAGDIKLTQDGSLIAPSYAISATSPGSGVTSVASTVDTHFSSQGIEAPRLLSNYLLVTQGAAITLTPQNIAALQSNQPVAGNAVFYVSTVTHGRFILSSDPSVSIPLFTQQQLQNLSVQFSHDGSRMMPGYLTSVSLQGLQSASLAAAIFFKTVNQPPVLAGSLVDQTAQLGQSFTYAIPAGTFVDPEGEPVTLSVKRFNSAQPLDSWISFDPLNNRFSGVPNVIDSMDIAVMARDPEGLISAPADFVLTVLPQPAPAAGGISLEKAIGSAVASGLVGLFFAGLQIYLKRAANKKLAQALGDSVEPFDLNVVRPVAKEIANQVKVTGCMNYTTHTEMAHFKAAVRTLLTELDSRGMDLRFTEMTEIKRDGIINEIATQVRLRLVPKGCCSALTSFFKSHVTPEAIRRAAPEIADAVVRALGVKAITPVDREIPALELQPLGEAKEVEEVTLVEPQEIQHEGEMMIDDEELTSSKARTENAFLKAGAQDLETSSTLLSKNPSAFVNDTRGRKSPEDDSQSRDCQCILA